MMGGSERPDPESPDAEFATAAGTATGLVWRGKPLHAFSGPRFIAAQSIGLRVFELAAQQDETGLYHGIYEDAAVVLRICGEPMGEVYRGMRKREEFREAALAATEGLTPAQLNELLEIFGKLMSQVQGGHEPAPKKKAQAKGRRR